MPEFKSFIMRKASSLFAQKHRPTGTKGKSKTESAGLKPAKPALAPGPQDAIRLLKADHKLMHGLFKEYENSRSTRKKAQLVARIGMELSIHAQIEEEIFYPVVKKGLKDKTLIPEAMVEHDTLRFLLAGLSGVETINETVDARIRVLAEYVAHHVKEEHKELFPKAKAAGVDMLELGRQLAARKAELVAARG